MVKNFEQYISTRIVKENHQVIGMIWCPIRNKLCYTVYFIIHRIPLCERYNQDDLKFSVDVALQPIPEIISVFAKIAASYLVINFPQSSQRRGPRAPVKISQLLSKRQGGTTCAAYLVSVQLAEPAAFLFRWTSFLGTHYLLSFTNACRYYAAADRIWSPIAPPVWEQISRRTHSLDVRR